jgi:hypothetical protein
MVLSQKLVEERRRAKAWASYVRCVKDYTGDDPAQAAKGQGMRLEVVRLPEAKRGFVLLRRRWVVEKWKALSSGPRS